MIDSLTRREREVAVLIAHEGLSDKEIAIRLGIAPGTIKVHMHAIRRKINAVNRTQVAIALYRVAAG